MEVQVRVREAASNLRSLMVGAAGEEGGVYSILFRIPDIAFQYINHLIGTSTSLQFHHLCTKCCHTDRMSMIGM